MKVLYFTKYSRNGASSRLRSYQYFPLLEEKGIQITVKPLFDDVYLKELYEGKKNKRRIVKSYIRRFFQLFIVFKYDKVVIEKELFPYFFSWFERLFSFSGVKYIVDYDDAIFHNYDLSHNKWIKKFLSNKIDLVMKNSYTVIAGNSYLAQRAQKAGAKKIVIIPTVIDTDRYQIKVSSNSKPFVIGWIGSPTTFKYLKALRPVFEQLALKYDIVLHIVGTKESLGLPNIEKHIAWSEDTEVASILTFDVGIMPLNDTPWEKGKCSYKLIQYMGCGLPVIASPVGMNLEVVKEGKNGFLANNNEKWYHSIEILLKEYLLSATLGHYGRYIVEKNYSLKKNKLKLLEAIKNENY